MTPEALKIYERIGKAYGFTYDGPGPGPDDTGSPFWIDRSGRRLLWDPLIWDGDAFGLLVSSGLRFEPPKYKGFGATCGSVTTFRDGLDGHALCRLAIMLGVCKQLEIPDSEWKYLQPK